MRQGVCWIATIPFASFSPDNWVLPRDHVVYIRGQQEIGAGGFHHWQILIWLSKKKSLAAMRLLFGNVHMEVTRSVAAEDYVWKEDTRVLGSQFEKGYG